MARFLTPVTADTLPVILGRPSATDNKYTRGVVGMVTGSDTYPGAAVLGVTAALAVGVGMVRYLGPPRVAELVLSTRPEVVTQRGPVDALVVGSGWDVTTRQECEERVGFLTGVPVPVVLDAQAMAYRDLFPGPAVLTPHQGELARLFELFDLSGTDSISQAAALADALNAVVVVKGHETVVLSPGGRGSVLPPAPTWLATAGTGDVLAGVMGAVVTGASATHGDTLSPDTLHDAAVLSAFIHQEAGRRASWTSEGDAAILASDLAGPIRQVVAGLLGSEEPTA